MPALGSLCLQSLARHMQSIWVKDYSENYLDEYQFRFVMGPFNDLGETWGAGTRSVRAKRRMGERCRDCLADPCNGGPPTAGSLVQDLIRLLGESRRLTRAALHLLLLPHLRELSLQPYPSLASNAIGQLVTLRCKVSRLRMPILRGAG